MKTPMYMSNMIKMHVSCGSIDFSHHDHKPLFLRRLCAVERNEMENICNSYFLTFALPIAAN